MSPARLLIRDGTVIDGTGAPGQRADVLIEGDRVLDVGHLGVDSAEIIDASDCLVTPGFIDLHTHADFSVMAFRDAHSAVMQGITTVVVGNCGGGVAPANPAHDVRRVAFAYRPDWGVEITWQGFDEYLAAIGRVSVNVAALIPHGAVRNAVMGLARRPPADDELALMRRMVEEAMAAGAIGLSTGLEYHPGCRASPDEIRLLAESVSGLGGVYATHMRDRGEHFSSATAEALAIARRTGVRLQLSHIAPRPYAPAAETEHAFAAIAAARNEGMPVFVDTFPETWGPGTLIDLFPESVSDAPPSDVIARLRRPEVRDEVRRYFAAGANFLLRVAGPEQIYIASNPEQPETIGRSLVELAAAARQDIADYCCEALLAAGPLFMSIAIRHVYANETDLQAVLALPYCSVESDGVVTSGEDADCGYPWNASSYGYVARLLAHYVRDTGFMPLEEAVRRLSRLPALAMGLDHRGSIEPGAYADLVILDLARLKDRTSSAHLARYPEGVREVLVNGRLVVRDGRHTGARPGGVIH